MSTPVVVNRIKGTCLCGSPAVVRLNMPEYWDCPAYEEMCESCLRLELEDLTENEIFLFDGGLPEGRDVELTDEEKQIEFENRIQSGGLMLCQPA